MEILPDGKIWLDAGDVVPVHCTCGKVYQPDRDSEKSVCPGCLRINWHHECPAMSAVPFVRND